MNETYTPGYSANAVDFMARRSAEKQARFLLPHLKSGQRILDIGCGPGTITLGLAKIVAPLKRARQNAAQSKIENVTFIHGSVYELPFANKAFDLVFAHAVFEHLKEPIAALHEIRRVLKPNGLVALRSPDWGGFIVAPETSGLQAAIKCYTDIQTHNGGDIQVGRKFPGLLRAAGLESKIFSAGYECYESAPLIAEYLALQLVKSGAQNEAESLRQWSRHPDAIFAQAWCEIIGIALQVETLKASQ
ncbi:MAG: methyltransferase domain-containing protein [Limisphaerales bacterium]